MQSQVACGIPIGTPDGSAALGGLISAIGRQRFESALMQYLNENCGADHIAVFQFAEGAPQRIASMSLDGTDSAQRQARLYLDGQFWRVDPSLNLAQQCIDHSNSMLLRLDVDDMPMSDLRDLIYRRMHIRERVLICGNLPGGVLGLSVLRSEKRGVFSGQEIAKLTGVADILLSVLEKHCDMKWRDQRLSLALTSLGEIERCCTYASERLPRRETEVCARILYGLSTTGIALDLGIGEETVMTYRKRVYHRLSISSHRELLLWYLHLWSEVGCGAAKSAPVETGLRPAS